MGVEEIFPTIEKDLTTFMAPLLKPSTHTFDFSIGHAQYSTHYSQEQIEVLRDLLLTAHKSQIRNNSRRPYVSEHLVEGVASRVRLFEVPPIYELIALFHDFGEDYLKSDEEMWPSDKRRNLRILNENLNRLEFSPFERNLMLHSVGILTKPSENGIERFIKGTNLTYEDAIEFIKFERCMGIARNNTVLDRETSKLQQLVAGMIYLPDMFDNGDFTETIGTNQFRNWRRMVNYGLPLYQRIKKNTGFKPVRLSEKRLDDFMLGDFRNRVLSGKQFFEDKGESLEKLGLLSEWEKL